jgi:hypothetical protein
LRIKEQETCLNLHVYDDDDDDDDDDDVKVYSDAETHLAPRRSHGGVLLMSTQRSWK